jgi:hypothetical protein
MIIVFVIALVQHNIMITMDNTENDASICAQLLMHLKEIYQEQQSIELQSDNNHSATLQDAIDQAKQKRQNKKDVLLNSTMLKTRQKESK